MLPSPSQRATLAFALAGLAIALRMASDWLFAAGGPFPYQLLQAGLLVVALAMLPQLERVFVTGGSARQSVQAAMWVIPFGLLGGLALAQLRFGGPQWPALEQAALVIGNNLFFPAVEELEFRGFMLAWLLERKVTPGWAVWGVAIVHLCAHAHWFWERNFIMLGVALLLFVWYGWLTVRTRSLWGAYVAHAAVNILGFLPTAGAGLRTP